MLGGGHHLHLASPTCTMYLSPPNSRLPLTISRTNSGKVKWSRRGVGRPGWNLLHTLGAPRCGGAGAPHLAMYLSWPCLYSSHTAARREVVLELPPSPSAISRGERPAWSATWWSSPPTTSPSPTHLILHGAVGGAAVWPPLPDEAVWITPEGMISKFYPLPLPTHQSWKSIL